MFKVDLSGVERLTQVLSDYKGSAEEAINDVLHNEVGDLVQERIKQLMPVSGKTWKGKKPSAKTGNSLRNINANLSVTVTTQKAYQYLYFPNDGTSTTRHIGEQYFFERGGEASQDEIIERCINKLTNTFESEV